MITLTRPIVFLDTETTGVWWKTVDRIVQVGLVKVWPPEQENRIEKWSSYVNPGISIPAEVIETHGITDEKVKDAPSFYAIIPQLNEYLQDCDVAGFNVEFDLNFLKAEYHRCEMYFPKIGYTLDVQKIYRHYNPRNLNAAVKQYVGEELVGAHDALVDTEGTAKLLWNLTVQHEDIATTVEAVCKQFEKKEDGFIDAEGKLFWRNGEACLNFSDHAGKPLKSVDPGFIRWTLNKDFSEEFKAVMRAALMGKFPTKENHDSPAL